MTILVTVILSALTFIFIIYPFFRQKPRLADSSGDEKLQELRSERDTTYSMLKELEFDFQSGILTEDDYRELEARYKRKAISTLKDIDNVGKNGRVEEEIEKQVQKLRRGKGKFCPQCGAETQKDDRFCSQCGANLNQGGPVD